MSREDSWASIPTSAQPSRHAGFCDLVRTLHYALIRQLCDCTARRAVQTCLSGVERRRKTAQRAGGARVHEGRVPMFQGTE